MKYIGNPPIASLIQVRPISFSKGFSLVELIVATSIIVILSLVAVSIGDLINQRDREVRLRQTLLDMRSAIDRYRTKNKGVLPTNMGVLLTERDDEGFPFLRGETRIPNNPVAVTPGPYWQIATITYEVATQTKWYPWGGTPPYTLGTTTVVPGGGGIADIRCSEGIGTGLNGYPYEAW